MDREEALCGISTRPSAIVARMIPPKALCVPCIFGPPINLVRILRGNRELLLYGALSVISTPGFCRVLCAALSRKPKDANADYFQSCYVHHLVVVHVIDLAVRNEEEVGSPDRPGRWQDAKITAIFQDRSARYVQPIDGKLKRRDARRADTVLNAYQAAVVPIEAIDARKACCAVPD